MTEINPALLLALAGALSGVLMASLAFAISNAPGWERELRSFAVIAVSAGTYCFLTLVHILPLSSRTLLLGERLLLAASFMYALAWIRHLAISDKRPLRRVERGAMIVGSLMAVVALIPGVLIVPPVRKVRVDWFGVTYTTATGSMLGVVFVFLTMTAVVVAAFSGRRWRDGWQSRLPMIGATALAVTGVTDTLGSMELIPMPQLVEAMTVVVVGALGISYTRRFIADAMRLDALSTKLEHEVASRTDELLRAQNHIAQQERLVGLGRVAAGVAHEINNPTSVIQQNLDHVQRTLSSTKTLTPELTKRLDQSRSATRRIANIVRQLLETGRDSHHPLNDNDDNNTNNSNNNNVAHAATRPFWISPVVAKAIAFASASAPDLRISTEISESLCASGDPALVVQVLINLLINAAHAAKDASGGGRAQVLGVRLGEEKRVRLMVKDNGPGIPVAIRERLFEPFTTTKTVGQGTGLGLAVSRGLMIRQGGSLFVASSTEAGTEMVLELPSAEEKDVGVELPSTRSLPESSPTRIKSDVRVLVIDDNDDLREVLTLQLSYHFHTVEEARTIDRALANVAGGHTYDVVLCDVMMPDGGAARWLTSSIVLDPRLAELTIIITGGPTTDEASALVAAHRDKVLFKPLEITAVEAMILRVAGRATTD